MLRNLIIVFGLTLSPWMVRPASAADAQPPAAQWLPGNAVLAVEVSQPDPLLDLALSSRVIEAVSSTPGFREQVAQPGFQKFLQGIRYLESQLGVDWKTGVRKLAGGGVTLALAPGPSFCLIIDARDERVLHELHRILLGVAAAEAVEAGEPNRVVSRTYRGVTAWRWGEGAVHALIGNRLVLASRPEVLKAALDLRSDPNGESLARLPAYQAARQAVGADAAVRVFVNLDLLRQGTSLQQSLEKTNNPLAALLAAGVLTPLRDSPWLAAGIRVHDETLLASVTAGGAVAEPGAEFAFARPSQPGDGAMPNLAVPRRIAALSLYRDLHSFYAAKDELFPERTSGLVFFENMMEIFFSGRDLTEEVLAEIDPEIRLVAAEQQFDRDAGEPRIRLPSFAAVLHMKHPERFGQIAEEAWQKALGLINFTRGQEALPGLVIDRPTHGDTKFTIAYFSTADEPDKKDLDTRFNFRPALVRLGDYLIVSSTEDLARDLIDSLRAEMAKPVKALSQVDSTLRIDGSQLASLLRSNRENLVRQNMIKEGNTLDQAERQIDILLNIIQRLGDASLDVGRRDGRPEANLQVNLHLP